ncbi:MAG: AAA family ATPase [Cyanobacteria bacterium P01_G01_bin.54]
MRIKSLEYYDNEYKWKLEKVDFLPSLNLLVGVSGAGKTRIIEAIYNLQSIANGASLNGVKWSVFFITDEEIEYTWNGEFETTENTVSGVKTSDEDEPARLVNEKLICSNGDIIVERRYSEIILNGNKTPKLSPFESVIDLLDQEDKIAPIKESLDKIILTKSVRLDEHWRLAVAVLEYFQNEVPSLLTLRESSFPVQTKLSILYHALPKEFKEVKEAFISIFPNVSDMKIELAQKDDILFVPIKLPHKNTLISIKEKGSEGWINNISSGMQKTLMFISELYLSPENSVILIDEFENSLGVNCLDSVTELVLNDRKMQFIITSHHPYIINNISPSCWRIVTRKAGLVTVKNSEDFHISASRQKAFIDLINVLEDDEDFEEE